MQSLLKINLKRKVSDLKLTKNASQYGATKPKDILEYQKMIKSILASLLLALSINVSAEETKVEDICVKFYEYAERIMYMRQYDTPISELMATTDNDYLRKIIIGAYRVPQFSLEANKQSEIKDYANKVATQCYMAMT